MPTVYDVLADFREKLVDFNSPGERLHLGGNEWLVDDLFLAIHHLLTLRDSLEARDEFTLERLNESDRTVHVASKVLEAADVSTVVYDDAMVKAIEGLRKHLTGLD